MFASNHDRTLKLSGRWSDDNESIVNWRKIAWFSSSYVSLSLSLQKISISCLVCSSSTLYNIYTSHACQQTACKQRWSQKKPWNLKSSEIRSIKLCWRKRNHILNNAPFPYCNRKRRPQLSSNHWAVKLLHQRQKKSFFCDSELVNFFSSYTYTTIIAIII